MDKILDVKNLTISFRTSNGEVKAVRGIDFDLHRGETLAIVGESGSGKSVTSRAIMGILANNAIVESGEIIFDGKDLLKINEDDFHEIRGEKISMIFQDPMSSLNPIIRIGRQLTEAMMIKGRMKQAKAKKTFNKTLNTINDLVNEATGADTNPAIKEQNQKRIATFKQFSYKHHELEKQYDIARGSVGETIELIDDLLYEIEKHAVKFIGASIKKIVKLANMTRHDYVINKDAPILAEFCEQLTKYVAEKKPLVEFIQPLQGLKGILVKAGARNLPNFFAMAYYLTFNSEPLPQTKTLEMNQILLDYIEKEYLNDFIDATKKGVELAFNKSLEGKKRVIAEINSALPYFEKEILDKAELTQLAGKMFEAIESSINRIELTKDSVAHTFPSSFLSAKNRYFYGIKNNEKITKQIEKERAAAEKKKAQGEKNVYFSSLSTVDLELAKQGMVRAMENLKEKYERDILDADKFDALEQTKAVIEFLKTTAEAAVHKVTQTMAKTKAIKIMEEVGIADARRRYYQYPYQFSGGMRQRIVIAIALSAEPEVLICDEPTTALDVTIQAQILELINRLKREHNLSVVFITHDLGVVANMADRIAVMYAGKIVEVGNVEEVFYDPKHPYTWALLSSMPDLNTTERLTAIPGTPPDMLFPPKGDAFAARNKYAMKIDMQQQPPFFKVTDTHYAATWLLHPDAPKVEMPKIVSERIARNKRLREEILAEDSKELEDSEAEVENEEVAIEASVVEVEEDGQEDAQDEKKPKSKPREAGEKALKNAVVKSNQQKNKKSGGNE